LRGGACRAATSGAAQNGAINRRRAGQFKPPAERGLVLSQGICLAVAVVALRQPRRVQRRNASRGQTGLPKSLRCCTRRYSSQRDEFHHAKQIRRRATKPTSPEAVWRSLQEFISFITVLGFILVSLNHGNSGVLTVLAADYFWRRGQFRTRVIWPP